MATNTAGRAREVIVSGQRRAGDVLQGQFDTNQQLLQDQQGQFRQDFLRQRGQTEQGFDPFIQSGGRALQRVEQGGTVGGLDRNIQDILGTESFQTLRKQQADDLLLQQTGSGLRRGDSLEQFANLSPELAFQLENQLFGRNRDLANVGFQGVDRRGVQGNQLTLGQGGLSGGLTSLEAQLGETLGINQAAIEQGIGQAEAQGIIGDASAKGAKRAAVGKLIGTVIGTVAGAYFGPEGAKIGARAGGEIGTGVANL